MRIIFLFIFNLVTFSLFANNIEISNVQLTGQNTADHYSLIQFDVKWANSWRTSNNESNWDGAWIFAKWRKGNTSEWRHCTLSQNNTTAATGSVLTVTNDLVGAFIHRNADGIGDVNFTGNRIRWDYGADGVLDNETVEIEVFALEMVYIPKGAFYLGSGGNEAAYFKEGGTTNSPYLVASHDAITVGNNAGQLTSSTAGAVANTGIPADFPKGFKAFWTMKYEISEQQYVDFLNHLDAARAALLTTGIPSDILSGTYPSFEAGAPERAMSHLNVRYFSVLADWSGLRPMTELEFEKICRGANITPLPNEHVWGTTNSFPLVSVNNPGADDEEVATPANANAAIGNPGVIVYGKRVRVGLFARPVNSTRELSGAAYYGVMNMGDNLREIVIGTVRNVGDFKDNVHGDGHINQDATSDITSFTTANSYMLKGGSYIDAAAQAMISDRARYNFSTETPNQQPYQGGRFVRTAE